MSANRETAGMPQTKVLFVLALLPALIYVNTLPNSFQYDDTFFILGNHYVHSLSGIGHFFVSPRLISNISLSGYRPITMATFALNYALSGEHAMGYHLFNIAIHILNTLIVYVLALAILRDFDTRHRAYAALLVAFLFAVHPINTQPVNYIAGRSTLLVACFSLVCFLLYIRANHTTGTSRIAALLVSLGAYVCALLSKEEAVALMGLLAAYELFRTRGYLDKEAIWRIVRNLLPYAMLTLVFMAFVVYMLDIVDATVQARGVPENLMTQARVLFLYLKMLAFPTNLSINHVVHISISFFEPVTFFAVIGVFLLLVGSLFFIRSTPVVPFGIWWFILTLVPTSTLVALKLVLNEQRLYLASVGLFLIAGACVGSMLAQADARKRGDLRRMIIGGMVIVVAILSALTIRRNAQWRTPLSLWNSALEKYPDSPRVNTQMANIYLKAGLLDEALAAAEKAVETAPDVVETHVALASAYSRLGMQDKALPEARAAVDLNPASSDAQSILGLVYARLERYSEAEAAWKRALELNPQNREARENLENLGTRRRVESEPKVLGQ
jgi:tetratricopeptide (TPR) repeat protein